MVSLVCSGTAARRRRLRRARVALPRKTAELSRRLLLGDTCPQLMPRRWVARAGPLWAWLGWHDWGLGCGRVSCAVACCANTGGSLTTRIQAWCRLAGLAIDLLRVEMHCRKHVAQPFHAGLYGTRDFVPRVILWAFWS